MVVICPGLAATLADGCPASNEHFAVQNAANGAGHAFFSHDVAMIRFRDRALLMTWQRIFACAVTRPLLDSR
jgi:hypothetical protein